MDTRWYYFKVLDIKMLVGTVDIWYLAFNPRRDLHMRKHMNKWNHKIIMKIGRANSTAIDGKNEMIFKKGNRAKKR